MRETPGTLLAQPKRNIVAPASDCLPSENLHLVEIELVSQRDLSAGQQRVSNRLLSVSSQGVVDQEALGG